MYKGFERFPESALGFLLHLGYAALFFNSEILAPPAHPFSG